MPKENKNLIVALDIGTSKVACLVGELGPDGMLHMLGMGSHESKGPVSYTHLTLPTTERV